MPSVEKAILDPFQPLTVPEALLVAVCGLLVVFLMLAMLMVVIYVISWVVNQIEATEAGVLKKQLREEGDEIVPGAPVAILETE